MLAGKKSTAQRIVYDAFEGPALHRREPLDAFDQAMRNVTPVIEVKPKRVGGAAYQVPVEIRHDRRQAIRYARARCRQEHGRPAGRRADGTATGWRE